MNQSQSKARRRGGMLLAASLAAAILLAMDGPAAAATASAAANASPAATAPAPSPAPGEAAGRIDVNAASAAELEALPGIGAAKAQAIIAERDKKPFASVDDLARVKGIGERTVEDLRGRVMVGSR